jgi:primase-polymerase (primpol)-like protein
MTVLVPNPGGIPPYLTELPRWVLWREEPRINRKTGEKEITRPPRSYHGGKKCDVNNPHLWADYASVATVIARADGSFDGYGIVLGEVVSLDVVLVGADLDAYFNPDGSIAPWARHRQLCRIQPERDGA